MAHQLIPSQLRDALAYMDGLEKAIKSTAEDPKWGDGLRLWLPNVIPLSPDYHGEKPVAWLVANDFDGYDLTTEEPK
jgi:hypothetical protein